MNSRAIFHPLLVEPATCTAGQHPDDDDTISRLSLTAHLNPILPPNELHINSAKCPSSPSDLNFETPDQRLAAGRHWGYVRKEKDAQLRHLFLVICFNSKRAVREEVI